MDLESSTLKSQIRARAQAALRDLTLDERQIRSVQASALLRRQREWQKAVSILFYAPRPDELDLSHLWPEAIAAGRGIALPRFNPETGQYGAAQLQDARETLAPGKFGIPEPRLDSPLLPLNRLDLVLVPGVAFDLSGRRLGRGRGYYDRLLADVRGIRCGVAFDEQIIGELPAEPHDVCLNCILTPTRWLTFGQNAAVK